MYRTSDKPQHIASNSSAIFAGSNDEDVKAFNARLHRDRVHERRSQGQKVRQARERLYGKQSHVVTVRYLPGFGPKA